MKRGGKTAIKNRIGKVEKEEIFIKGKTGTLCTLEEEFMEVEKVKRNENRKKVDEMGSDKKEVDIEQVIMKEDKKEGNRKIIELLKTLQEGNKRRNNEFKGGNTE